MAGGQGAPGGGGPAQGVAEPPEVAVHDYEQARAVLAVAAELGVPVRLRSAPGAAGYAGVGFLHALGREVGHELIVDCGDDAGLVLGALRTGCRDVAFSGPAETARRLADIADQLDARFRHEAAGPPSELLVLTAETEAGAPCRVWLRRAVGHGPP